MSTFKDDPKGTVSDWVQTTLLKSGVPVADVAAKFDKSQDLIYKFANRNAEQNIPAYALVQLIAVSGDFTILQELAEMFGFIMIPRGAWEGICQGVKAMEGAGT